MKIRTAIILLISVLFLTLSSCTDKYFTHDGTVWGTTYHIVYQSNADHAHIVDSILEAIDSELSYFNPSSTLSAVNRGDSVSVGKAFRDVFAISQHVAAISGRYYDPTVGPLMRLWGFHGKAGTAPVPDSITSILGTTGILECSIDSAGTVHRKTDRTELDFSSVAKGYGVQAVADALAAAGVENYMVEIGGEIAVRGVNSRGQAWHIQIDAPTPGAGHERLCVVPLGPEPRALASSGNYRNFRTDSAGRTYGHTISPVTGYPAQGEILSASIACSDCGLADALATAAMAIGRTDSVTAMLEGVGADYLLVVAGAEATSPQVIISEGFRTGS